jgi:hypothetical protein
LEAQHPNRGAPKRGQEAFGSLYRIPQLAPIVARGTHLFQNTARQFKTQRASIYSAATAMFVVLACQPLWR